MPILVLNLIFWIIVITLAAGLYFFDTVIRSDSVIRRMRGKVIQREPADTSFYDSMREKGMLEDVYMQSEDGLLLHGIKVGYVEEAETDVEAETAADADNAAEAESSDDVDAQDDPRKKQWAIICHGYTTDAAMMGEYAEMFWKMGFSTLSVDMRGHGDSAGTYRGMGWHDSFDVLDWTQWLIDHYGEDIGVLLFGVSMGGAAVMMASGHDIQPQVRCIVEDCGYTSIKDELKYQTKRRYGLPSFPLVDSLSFWTRIFCGYSIKKDGNAVAQVRRSKTPIMFIHGEDDDFVPFKMHRKIIKSAGCEKESYTVKNAGHTAAMKTDRNGYFKAVSGFAGRYFEVAENSHL